MKKIFSFIISFCLIISFSLGYVIEDMENTNTPIGLDGSKSMYVKINHSDFDNFTYSISSDKGTMKKFVRSYDIGGYTALQVCSIGNIDGCTHKKEASEGDQYVEYKKSEIIDITKPTCLENGVMTIRCKNIKKAGGISGLFGGTEECGVSGTIILEKTGHTVKEGSTDGKCENCNEVVITHKAVEEWSVDSEKHYKKCVVNGCSEVFEEAEHFGGTHGNDGFCAGCNSKYQTHVMNTSSFSSNDTGHLYGCSYENCQEVFNEEHIKNNILVWDANNHWFGCTNEQCEKRYDEESHSDGNNSDGVCTICKRKYDGELEKFSIKNIKTDGTYELDAIGDNVQLEIEYFPENLADTNFVWEVENEKVATVSQEGVVTAVSEGVTVIHIFWNDEEITCTIYVAMKSFKIEADDEELLEGEDTKVRIITKNISLEDVEEWSVSPQKLARIKSNGTLHAIPGKAAPEGEEVTVYAKLKNGLVASTDVFIKHGKASHETEGECNICGIELEKHKVSNAYDGHDNELHWKTCSNSKCKGEHFFEESHTSSIECTKCSWKSSTGGGVSGNGGSGSSGSGNTGGGSTGGGNIGGGSTGGGNTENGESFWNHNERLHWKEFSNGKRDPSQNQEKHTFINGMCKCGRLESQNTPCDHKNKGEEFSYVGKKNNQDYHVVLCGKCGTELKDEYCTPRDNPEECKCRKDGKVEVETAFDIPIKVYYVEEDGLYSADEYASEKENRRPVDAIEIDYTITQESNPKFTWTMSTIPNQEFKNGQHSNDGTIDFWYSNKKFYAKLLEDNRAYLSGEVIISIKLEDAGQSDRQEIKLIKNGPPSSRCQVFLDKQKVALGEDTLKLLIKTVYDNDFNDRIVRNLRLDPSTKDEFPLYQIKNNRITVTSQDGSKIRITGTPTVSEVTDGSFNGYIAEIPIEPKQVGEAKIEIELTTEYIFNKHKTIEKERKYSAIINVVKKVTQQNINSPSTPLPETPSEPTPPPENNNGFSSALYAAAGVLGLLLVAIIGAKMFGHH